jgi:hypothetical protein
VAQKLLINQFQLEIADNTAFYEYEILDLEQGGRTKKKAQALFRKAIATWGCFKDDLHDSFATDGQKTIVAWKKLHDTLDFTKITHQGSVPDHEGTIWSDSIPLSNTTSTSARFTFVGQVNVADLLQKTQSNVTYAKTDFSSVERCINILISKFLRRRCSQTIEE